MQSNADSEAESSYNNVMSQAPGFLSIINRTTLQSSRRAFFDTICDVNTFNHQNLFG